MANDETASETLDDEEQAFNRYIESMLQPLPTRARPILQKRRIPRGTPGGISDEGL